MYKGGRRSLRSMVRYAPYAARAFQAMMRRGRKGRSSTVNKNRFARSRKAAKSGTGVTTQHDTKNVYRKSYMPRYKKRSWKRFVNKVHAISEKELGARQVLFNVSDYKQNNTATNQIVGSVCLYSQRSTLSYMSDLYQIGALENTGNSTAAAGDTVDPSTKILFQSGILDVTFRNASSRKNADATYSQPAEAKLEVDVYEIMMKDDATDSALTYQNIEGILNENESQTKPIGGVGTEIAYTKRGCTPFELSYALSRFKLKIAKKTKYILGQGETFTYQVRDPKRRSITRKDLEAEVGFNRPGWTRIIYYTAKLVPGLTVGLGTLEYQEVLYTGITRKYMYKVEGINEDRTYYATQ